MKRKEKQKNEIKTNKVTVILLIISILLLLASGTYFIILKDKNNNYDKELSNLNTSITKAKNKLTTDAETKEEQDKKLENLKNELKDNVEELEIWKELKKQLEDALS